MKLVVDSNRIIAALIKEGPTRKILCNAEFEFLTLDYVIEEVKKYQKYILEKSNMTEEQFDLLFMLVMDNIHIVPEQDVKKCMPEAINIMKHIDLDDAPIMACALAIRNDGVWTEDKDFERQKRIKVWSTQDLLSYF